LLTTQAKRTLLHFTSLTPDALQQATATGSAPLLLLQQYKYRAQESVLASAMATDNDDTATDALQQATATGSALLLLLQKYKYRAQESALASATATGNDDRFGGTIRQTADEQQQARAHHGTTATDNDGQRRRGD